MKNRHKGVCVIVTNLSRNLFYVQQKDNNYQIKKFRGSYSFFGGEVEKNEDSKAALIRELHEELDVLCAHIICSAAKKIKSFEVKTKSSAYNLVLYEAVLANYELKKISASTTKEGTGILFSRKEIEACRLVHGLGTVLKFYLNERGANDRS